MMGDDFKDVMVIYHDPDKNIFLDSDCGYIIPNIFEMITPNDLYLYRNDPGLNIFPHRDIPDLLCEVVEWEDIYHEQSAFEIFSGLCNRSGCKFSDYTPAARGEICRACTGGDRFC